MVPSGRQTQKWSSWYTPTDVWAHGRGLGDQPQTLEDLNWHHSSKITDRDTIKEVQPNLIGNSPDAIKWRRNGLNRPKTV